MLKLPLVILVTVLIILGGAWLLAVPLEWIPTDSFQTTVPAVLVVVVGIEIAVILFRNRGKPVKEPDK